MDNYLKELFSICKLPLSEIIGEYKIIVCGGKCIYISNFLKIIDYSNSKVVLKIKKNTIEILGENLSIQLLNKGEILVSGIIIGYTLGVISENK